MALTFLFLRKKTQRFYRQWCTLSEGTEKLFFSETKFSNFGDIWFEDLPTFYAYSTQTEFPGRVAFHRLATYISRSNIIGFFSIWLFEGENLCQRNGYDSRIKNLLLSYPFIQKTVYKVQIGHLVCCFQFKFVCKVNCFTAEPFSRY